jgi:3-oxoadipate enol-lactonase
VLVSVRGTRINVIDQGSGEPVVLLHGVGGNSRNWGPQIPALAATRRVLAVDARGHGGSDPTDEPMSLQDYADDVVAVMAELGITRAPIVGMSMGGMIAQTLVVSSPELVSSLVLADTCARADEQMAAGMRAVGGLALAQGMRTVAQSVRPVTFSPAAIAEERPYIAEFEDQFAETDTVSFKIAMDALTRLDVLDRLPGIAVPTLVLSGAEDTLIPGESSKAVAAAVPGAEFQVIENSGHLSNLDQPEAFTEHLLRFLAAVG